jgi:hypothetical protein
MDKTESRRALKTFMPQATRIVNQIDPLGLIEMGAPKDEYDDVVGEAARLLVRRAPDLDVRLAEFIHRQYDLVPDRGEVATLATRLTAAWEQARSRG